MSTDYIQSALEGGQNGVLASRPFISTNGKNAGKTVVIVNTGKDSGGNDIYEEQVIRANAGETTLRHTDWVDIDDKLTAAAEQRLVIIDDLIQSGLTYAAGDLGTLVTEWDAVSHMTDASVTMDGETEVDKDRLQFRPDGVPIPIIHKPFKIGKRAMLASRRNGAGLDLSHGTAAARSVARTSERMAIFGHQLNAVGSQNQRRSIPGLLTHPGRSVVGLLDWTDPSVTGEQILGDVLKMITQAEINERAYGPFRLYIPGAVHFRFREDYKAFGDKTLMDRILEVNEIDGVRVADELPGNAAVLVQWMDSTIDLAMIANIQTIQWQSPSGWTDNFQVFAAWAPRIKADYDGHLGVVHGTIGGA